MCLEVTKYECRSYLQHDAKYDIKYDMTDCNTWMAFIDSIKFCHKESSKVTFLAENVVIS